MKKLVNKMLDKYKVTTFTSAIALLCVVQLAVLRDLEWIIGIVVFVGIATLIYLTIERGCICWDGSHEPVDCPKHSTTKDKEMKTLRDKVKELEDRVNQGK